VTEIFLPRRVYKENDIDWLLSPGGRMQFDWEGERAWVWFVDKWNPLAKPRLDRVRRVDLWVPSKAKSKQLSTTTLVSLIVPVASVILWIAWRLQQYQWERERRAGLASGWGLLGG